MEITKLQVRNDTTEKWLAVNPILEMGEIGYDNTVGKMKVGDGISSWNELKYMSANDEEIVALESEINTLKENSADKSELDTKVNVQQGTENNGKVLGIGSDGNVLPIDATPSIDESNLVHKTGDEVITGKKTFNGTLSVSDLPIVTLPDTSKQIEADFSKGRIKFEASDLNGLNYKIVEGQTEFKIPEGEEIPFVVEMPNGYACQESFDATINLSQGEQTIPVKRQYCHYKDMSANIINDIVSQKMEMSSDGMTNKLTSNVYNGMMGTTYEYITSYLMPNPENPEIIDEQVEKTEIIIDGQGIRYNGFAPDKDYYGDDLPTANWVNNKIVEMERRVNQKIGTIDTVLDEINGEII